MRVFVETVLSISDALSMSPGSRRLRSTDRRSGIVSLFEVHAVPVVSSIGEFIQLRDRVLLLHGIAHLLRGIAACGFPTSPPVHGDQIPRRAWLGCRTVAIDPVVRFRRNTRLSFDEWILFTAKKLPRRRRGMRRAQPSIGAYLTIDISSCLDAGFRPSTTWQI